MSLNSHLAPSGSGGIAAETVGGSTGATDNAILRADGTGGATAQASDIIIIDNETMQLPSDGAIQWSDSATPGSGTADNKYSRHAAGYHKFWNGSSFITLYVPSSSLQQVYAQGALALNTDAAGEGVRFTVGGATDGFEIYASSGSGAVFRNSSDNLPSWTLSKALVEANTAGSGAPNVLVAAESKTILTNEGTTAENYHTLPTAASGYVFTFIVQDADGIRITAAAGDTIRPIAGTAASATGGFIRCATQGAFITLLAINATEWIAIGSAGVWTIDV